MCDVDDGRPHLRGVREKQVKRLFLVLGLVGLIWTPIGGQSRTLGHRIRQTSNSYTTTFVGSENPISQGGHWVNAGLSGLDWQNIRIVSGFAYGTQSGTSGLYDDSVALLTGTWANDQTVTATVHVAHQDAGSFEEFELWLHGSISAHLTKGYELVFRNTSDGSQYAGITRWNGVLGTVGGCAVGCAFDEVDTGGCTGPGIHDGDILKGTIIGNTITSYVNGVSMCSADITSIGGAVYTTGNPGFGHWYRINGASGTSVADHSFTKFTAVACASGPC